MTYGDPLRVRLLVGRIEEEDGFVVADSIDESIYDIGGEDACTFEKTKREWPSEYEWREVVVRIDKRLVAGHFSGPEVNAIPEMPA